MKINIDINKKYQVFEGLTSKANIEQALKNLICQR